MIDHDFNTARRQILRLMDDLVHRQKLDRVECERALVALSGYAIGRTRDVLDAADLLAAHNDGIGVGAGELWEQREQERKP